ncbi:MAG TPA: VOC family protein [Caulobacteraceae bacterium]
MKQRDGEPWIPAAEYGALLPEFTVNLVVRDMDASLAFYREVLRAQTHYADPDFAAIRILGLELMLHTDHTYEKSHWHGALLDGAPRGVGLELRLMGMDPDEVAARAAAVDAVKRLPMTRGHGWRETIIADPDGYVWAVGVAQRRNP